MYVIAKMIVSSVEDYGQSRKVIFNAQHDSMLNKDDPENKSFTKATPSGSAWMTIDNKYVWDAFKPVQAYDTDAYKKASHYVVFVPCAEHTLEDVYRALGHLQSEEAPAT